MSIKIEANEVLLLRVRGMTLTQREIHHGASQKRFIIQYCVVVVCADFYLT